SGGQRWQVPLTQNGLSCGQHTVPHRLLAFVTQLPPGLQSSHLEQQTPTPHSFCSSPHPKSLSQAAKHPAVAAKKQAAAIFAVHQPELTGFDVTQKGAANLTQRAAMEDPSAVSQIRLQSKVDASTL